MDFNYLKGIYNNRFSLCDKIGYIYTDDLYEANCNKWCCNWCRSKKKYMLFIGVLNSIYNFNLDRHFIITFDNNKYGVDYNDSYRIMSNQWINFKKCIQRKYGYFDYIKFARSQKNGYCHYHILVNKYIKWKFLDMKRKKYNIGFTSIQKNKSVADYILKEYWKDWEWIIPFNVRHYTCSKNIKLNNYIKDKGIFYEKDMNLNDIKKDLMMNHDIDWDYNPYLTRMFQLLKKKKII